MIADRVDPKAADLMNANGDRELPRLIFRCGGCGRVHRSVAFPHTPVYAKYHCRFCDYTTTIKTRDEAMDTVEGHIEEGAYEQSLRARKSVNIRIAETPFGKAALID